MTNGRPSLLAVVKESAIRRLGRPTLVGYLVLLGVVLVGVAASVGWMFAEAGK